MNQGKNRFYVAPGIDLLTLGVEDVIRTSGFSGEEDSLMVED